MTRSKRPPEERFWEKVDKSGECWLWTAARNKQGYGMFFYNGNMGTAHRFSYELHFGSLPKDLEACHNCPGGDNPSCVNPAHLFAGTRIQNVHDALAKGWVPSATKLSLEEKEDLCESFLSGASKASIARHFDIDRSSVRWVLDHNPVVQ